MPRHLGYKMRNPALKTTKGWGTPQRQKQIKKDDEDGAEERAEVVDSAGLYEGTVAPQNGPHVILSDPKRADPTSCL